MLALVLAAGGRAQTPNSATPAPVPADNPVLDPTKAAAPAPAADHAAPQHSRVMSDEVAASLAGSMPKYNPPPKQPEPTPEEEAKDLRDVDKPKNRIIRLQKFIVKEPKPPVFRDRELEGKKGLTDRGMKSNPGLGIGNFGGLNRPTALMMYEEQERLNNMSDLKNDAKDAKASGDSAAADYISKESKRTYYRPSDFGWNSDVGPPSGK
jgi:hypothetical protein